MASKVNFPFLDGIRFFAALLVFTAHFIEFGNYFIPGFTLHNPEIELRFGSIGVTIFFVLSGFLITYLLLQEKESENRISIKKFYFRRMLRIWPLYFLIVGLSFLVLNNLSFFQIPGYDADYRPYTNSILPFYIVLLPQIPFILFPAVPYANILWSIGVEEVFYLFWPFAITKRSKVKLICLLIIACWLLLKLLLLVLRKYNLLSQPQAEILFEFVERNRFYCFAIGGLAAYYLKYKEDYIDIIKNTLVQLAALVVLLLFLFPVLKAMLISLIMHEAVAFASAIIIIGCAVQLKGYAISGSRPLRYLGKISYGIYCYHLVAIVIIYKVFGSLPAGNIFLYGLLYAAALTVTVIFASLSYYLLEIPFLSLKQKYY